MSDPRPSARLSYALPVQTALEAISHDRYGPWSFIEAKIADALMLLLPCRSLDSLEHPEEAKCMWVNLTRTTETSHPPRGVPI